MVKALSERASLVHSGTVDPSQDNNKMEWEVVIGLETHVQLSTKSKIFSGASAAFGAEPNGRLSGLIPQGTLMLGRPASDPGTV